MYHVAPPLQSKVSVTSEVSGNNRGLSLLKEEGNYTRDREFMDRMGNKHTLCMSGTNKTYKGKSYQVRRVCEGCGEVETVAFCFKCNRVLCFPFRLPKNMTVKNRDASCNGSCFVKHVKEQCRTSPRLGTMSQPIEMEEV